MSEQKCAELKHGLIDLLCSQFIANSPVILRNGSKVNVWQRWWSGLSTDIYVKTQFLDSIYFGNNQLERQN